MTLNTERLSLPYPSEGQQDWYKVFEDMVEVLDDYLHGLNRNRHAFLYGGGTVTWDNAAGLLSWDGAITLIHASGLRSTIDPSSIAVEDGEFLVHTIETQPSRYTPVLYASNKVTPGPSELVIAHREADTLQFSNGLGLGPGRLEVTGLGLNFKPE